MQAAAGRSRTRYGIAARILSDYARHLVPEVADEHAEPGDFIRTARRALIIGQVLREQAVLHEIACGVSWAAVAAALGQPEESVREKYEPLAEAYAAGRPPPATVLPDGSQIALVPEIPAAPTEDDRSALIDWYARSADTTDSGVVALLREALAAQPSARRRRRAAWR